LAVCLGLSIVILALFLEDYRDRSLKMSGTVALLKACVEEPAETLTKMRTENSLTQFSCFNNTIYEINVSLIC